MNLRTRALLLAVTAALTAASASAATPQRAQLSDIEDEVMCPICGTTLALSQAPQAERERAFVRRLIAAGRTKQQIKDALVAQYGEEVLATPGNDGFDLAAWLVPILGFAGASVAIAIGIRRWRGRGRPARDSASVPTVDAERLERDLSRYDL